MAARDPVSRYVRSRGARLRLRPAVARIPGKSLCFERHARLGLPRLKRHDRTSLRIADTGGETPGMRKRGAVHHVLEVRHDSWTRTYENPELPVVPGPEAQGAYLERVTRGRGEGEGRSLINPRRTAKKKGPFPAPSLKGNGHVLPGTPFSL